MQGHNANQSFVLNHGDNAEIAGGQLAERRGQRFFLLRHFEDAVHHGLHISVAFRSQRLQDFLFRDHADHVAAANDGEIVLQGVHGFLQRVF